MKITLIFLCLILSILICELPRIGGEKQRLSGNSRVSNPRKSSSDNRLRVRRAMRGICRQFAPCNCRSRSTLECSRPDCLQRLPNTTMTRREGAIITQITVTRQRRFTTIAENDLNKLPNLLIIRFFNNKINTIDANAFRSNRKVEYLDLHRNNLIVFPSAISKLRELRKLNLDRNRISSIPLRAFDYNPKLEQLILRRNSFMAFPDCYFPRSLVKLSLGVNHISVLKDLRYLKQLRVLRLEANQLKRVNSRALPDSLIELRLCNNSLDSSYGLSFDNLYNLRRLRLAGNPNIREIDRRMLTRSQIPLVELDLRDCGIASIDLRAFSCFTNLRTVELQGNQLEDYKPEWFSFNRKLKRISLAQNPWSCDCTMKQHLDDLAIVANNSFRAKSNRRRHEFDSDFENITCSKLSGQLSTRRGATETKLFVENVRDSCPASSKRWKFKPHKSRNPCPLPPTPTPTTRSSTASSSSNLDLAFDVQPTPDSLKGVSGPKSTPKSDPISTRTTTRRTTPTTTQRTTPKTSTTTRRTTTPTTTKTTTPTTTRATTTRTTTTATTKSTTTSAESKTKFCAKNGECAWPFVEKGETYDQTCITTAGWTSTYTWCYTNVESGAWEYCGPEYC